jgi:hypothetical protein
MRELLTRDQVSAILAAIPEADRKPARLMAERGFRRREAFAVAGIDDSADWLLRVWRPAVAAAGVTGARTHDLRLSAMHALKEKLETAHG